MVEPLKCMSSGGFLRVLWLPVAIHSYPQVPSLIPRRGMLCNRSPRCRYARTTHVLPTCPRSISNGSRHRAQDIAKTKKLQAIKSREEKMEINT